MNLPAASAGAAPIVGFDELEVRSNDVVAAVKRIVATDPYLAGHYPGLPIYPGVFVVESARQAVVELVRRTRGESWRVSLRGLRAATFTAPMLPGGTLQLVADCRPGEAGELRAHVQCTSGDGQPVARLDLMFRMTKDPSGA